eukprot:CAMPEP_0181327056 /NCGR_PEP_ID=MMETSP1101-20121128/21872_1 /TAXON_ID=46948 /ORGANISM="Rhodomonas abbreviata, Strain Caron Lab Isolate" /LENGTH=244 /DNA_ID=CAMNT_0023435639 /DNA_START=108 /DNA_END=842 /DNA_ORIENTATION=+
MMQSPLMIVAVVAGSVLQTSEGCLEKVSSGGLLAFGAGPGIKMHPAMRSHHLQQAYVCSSRRSISMLKMDLSQNNLDSSSSEQAPNVAPPTVMQFSESAMMGVEPQPNPVHTTSSSPAEQQTRSESGSTPTKTPVVSKTRQLIGLARRGWWLSALAVALDGAAAVIAVVCGGLALLSVAFMDIAMPSSTSFGLVVVGAVSALAGCVFIATSAASAFVGMLAMSDAVRTYFQMHRKIDIMTESNE